MTAWAIAYGVLLGLGLWSVVSLVPRLNRPRLARRIAPYLADVSAGARDALAPPPPGPLPIVGVLLAPGFARGQRILDRVLGGSDLTARRLRQAGSPLDLAAFRSRQLLCCVAGAMLGVDLAAIPSPLPAKVAVVAVAALAGLLIPDQLLQRRARARLARLNQELPVMLEFLTLCLSAGEGVLDALRRVSRIGRGELAAELSTVVAAVGTGLPFAETLDGLSRDLQLPALTRCVDQLLGALERGTPVAEVFRAQAQDSRAEAKRVLLETAGAKEVGMLVPLVFLILPVTVAFAIFPGLVVLQLGL